VGLDDGGGVLQTRGPLSEIQRARIVHPQLNVAWSEDVSFQVSNIRPADGGGAFDADFQTMSVGAARTQYFRRVLDAIPSKALETPRSGDQAPRAPASSADQDAPRVASRQSKMLTAVIQSVNLVFDYYLGSTPAMQKAQRRSDERQLGLATATAEVKGSDFAATLIFSLGADLIAMMCPRVCGYRMSKSSPDERAAMETTEILADQIFFRAELLASEFIRDVVIDVIDISIGARGTVGPAEGVILPFTIEGTHFFVELPVKPGAGQKVA
jgi:hypothetical protein